MATKVHMEALSPTMEEGRLVKWHKHEGDAVKVGDTLAEVETDKAIMDLQARADGMLRQVSVAEGQTVPVGKEIAVIVAPGETVGATPAPATRPAHASVSGSGERGAVSSAPVPAAAAVAPADPARVKASPLAKRMAKEAGVDLQLLQGSGPGGRVVRKDLESVGSNERGAVPTAAPQPTVRREVLLPSPV